MLTRVLCASALVAVSGAASLAQQPHARAGVFEQEAQARSRAATRESSRTVSVERDGDTVLIYAPSAKGGTSVSFRERDTVIEMRILGDRIADLEVAVNGAERDGYRAEMADGHIVVTSPDGETVARLKAPVDDGAKREITVHAQAARESAQNAVRAHGRSLQGGRQMAGEAQAAPRRVIGISASTPSEALAAQLGLDADQVVVVETVNEGLPAHKAGLKRFDIITKVEGAPPATLERIREVIDAKGASDPIRLTIVRGGAEQTVELRPVEQSTFTYTTSGGAQGEPPFGVGTLRRLSDEERARVEEAMAHARDALTMQHDRLSELHEHLEEQMRHLSGQLRGKLQDEEVAEQVRRAYEGAIREIREVNVQEQVERAIAEVQRAMHESGTRGELRAFPEIRFFEGDEAEGRGVVVAPTPPPARAPAVAPTPPMGGRMSRAEPEDGRLQALEERMARIERLLERIAEDRNP